MSSICARPRNTGISTVNSTSTRGPNPCPEWAVKVVSPLGLLICLGGLVGNGLVLGLLGFSLKWGDFTVFIFHLSVADFLYLSSQIVYFTQRILAAIHCGKFHVKYMVVLTHISYMVGMCLLTAISVWRCLSVLVPIWCKLHASRLAPPVVCALIWVLSISANVHYFLVCRVRKFCNPHSCDVYITIWPVFFCVLCSVTVMCTLIVLFKVRWSTQRRPPLKLYVTVVLTVLFVLSAFPFGIRLYFFRNSDVYYEIRLLLQLLACVNSSANPLVYYFVGRIGGHRGGRNLREVFRKTLGDESALGRGSSSGASTVQGEEGGGASQAL